LALGGSSPSDGGSQDAITQDSGANSSPDAAGTADGSATDGPAPPCVAALFESYVVRGDGKLLEETVTTARSGGGDRTRRTTASPARFSSGARRKAPCASRRPTAGTSRTSVAREPFPADRCDRIVGDGPLKPGRVFLRARALRPPVTDDARRIRENLLGFRREELQKSRSQNFGSGAWRCLSRSLNSAPGMSLAITRSGRPPRQGVDRRPLHPRMNASRSALMVSASVVGIP